MSLDAEVVRRGYVCAVCEDTGYARGAWRRDPQAECVCAGDEDVERARELLRARRDPAFEAAAEVLA